MTKAETVCELFKLLRVQWRTRAEIERDLGMDGPAVTKWVTEFTANGMFSARQRQYSAGPGTKPTEFCLAPEWGGKAE